MCNRIFNYIHAKLTPTRISPHKETQNISYMKRFASEFPTCLALQYAHMYTDLKDIISIDFSVQGIVIMHIGILEKLKMCRDTIKEKITHIFTTKQSVQKPKQFKLKVLDHPLYSQIRHF